MAFSGVIREADTEEAANTAEARGRRSVAAARAGLPPPGTNPLPVPQVSQPPARQAPRQTQQTPSQTSQVDVGDVFGSLVGLLRDSLIIFGVPTRGMFAARAQRKKIEQAAAVYDATVTATKQAIELFGGLDFNDPDAQAVVGKFAARFDAVVPGGGESLLGALDIFQSQGEAAIDSAGEHRDNLLALCGQTPGTMACIKKALADTAMVKQWDVVADEQRLPVIVEKFGAIEDAVKDNPVLEQLRENGWTIDDLHRLPKEFQFTPDELITIGRNEQLQNALIEIGFRPPSLIRKEAEAEITEGTKAKFRQPPAGTNLAKLQTERAKHEAAGNFELARETGKRIEKEISEVGLTPEDIKARESAEAEAAEDLPVDAFTADILDLPVDMTQGQARERGINIPNKKERETIQKIETGAKSAVQLTDEIETRIKADPAAITAGGDVASFFNQLRSNLQGLSDVLGLDVDFAAEFDEHSNTFQRFGVDTDVLKSLVLDLSYVQAISRGQEGRGLSDKDVERFSKIIGGRRADPVVVTEILDSLNRRFDNSFRNTVESITRKKPASLLSHIREVEALLEKQERGETITDSELQSLTPRARKELRRRLKK